MVTEKRYKKSIGTFELASSGVGGTIGPGIFVVPGIAAGCPEHYNKLYISIRDFSTRKHHDHTRPLGRS